MINFANSKSVRSIIKRALHEDILTGDITTNLIADGSEMAVARTIAKGDFIVAGADIFAAAFKMLDSSLTVKSFVKDGTLVAKGEIIVELTGKLTALLAAERTALNIFQRMSGIATMTSKFVQAVAGTKAKILDTRKTAPLLRVLDKYAVRVGDGNNHRFALYDGILIKENHIAAAGGITNALNKAQQGAPHTMKIEIEVKNLDELSEAITAGADIVMLDNMSVPEMSEAVTLTKGRVLLEASGNVSLDNVRAIAETGVDLISVGTLTHSVTAADISLLLDSD